MNAPTKVVLIAGVLLVPAWYVFRSATDKASSRLGWNYVFASESERLSRVIDELNGELAKRTKEAEMERLAAEEQVHNKVRQEAMAASIEELDKLLSETAKEVDIWYRDVGSLRSSERGNSLGGYDAYVAAYQQFTANPPKREVVEMARTDLRRIKDDFARLLQEGVAQNPNIILGERISALHESLQKIKDQAKTSRESMSTLLDYAEQRRPDTLDGRIRRMELEKFFDAYETKRRREREIARGIPGGY
jgi:hypothetical protein